MSKLMIDVFSDSENRVREERRARLRVDVTEALLILMEDFGVSKSDLADRIGVTRSAVTQALCGTRNLTLNLISDIAAALGQEACFFLKPMHVAEEDRTLPAPEYFGTNVYLSGISGAAPDVVAKEIIELPVYTGSIKVNPLESDSVTSI